MACGSPAGSAACAVAVGDVPGDEWRMPPSRTLPVSQATVLIDGLQQRFAQAAPLPGLAWDEVRQRLQAQPAKLWSLREMERSGGEPELLERDPATGELIFVDCCSESPAGRRSVCYDRAGWESRREHRPETTAVDQAAEMGVELLDEERYLRLQQRGEFDRRTSSWLLTPASVRQLGGALYGERHYGRVFVGCNGAQSYYAARGFRAMLRI